MKTIEELKLEPRLTINQIGNDGFSGDVSFPLWRGSVICSTGAGWEHVSVSPYKHRITPSWEDMCRLKDMFFKDDEAVIQIHPPKAEYVNNAKNCLHLWRCTYREMVLPPSVLVGVRKGQTMDEISREIREAYRMAEEAMTNAEAKKEPEAIPALKGETKTCYYCKKYHRDDRWCVKMWRSMGSDDYCSLWHKRD